MASEKTLTMRFNNYSYFNFINYSLNKIQDNLDLSSKDACVLVYFDLETGGLSYNDDILQVAIKCNEFSYVSYITATKPITEKASIINGLTTKDGQLFCRGKPVVSYNKRIVVGQLIQYLQKLNKSCILVGHNVRAFDIPRLILLFHSVNLLDEFLKIAHGLSDTMNLFKNKFPERESIQIGYKLTTLVADLSKLSN